VGNRQRDSIDVILFVLEWGFGDYVVKEGPVEL